MYQVTNLFLVTYIGIYIFMSFHLNAADQTIFNYRLSRARRMIENTFGILASRYITYQAHCMTCCTISYKWRIFRHPIIANPDNVITYTEAAITLHNFLRCTEPGIYSPSAWFCGWKRWGTEVTLSEDLGGKMMNLWGFNLWG